VIVRGVRRRLMLVASSMAKFATGLWIWGGVEDDAREAAAMDRGRGSPT
jgi:hypothetical protein